MICVDLLPHKALLRLFHGEQSRLGLVGYGRTSADMTHFEAHGPGDNPAQRELQQLRSKIALPGRCAETWRLEFLS